MVPFYLQAWAYLGLSVQAPLSEPQAFNRRIIECFRALQPLIQPLSIALQVTSSDEQTACLSRAFWQHRLESLDIEPYYATPIRLQAAEASPYHLWELIDEQKDWHHLIRSMQDVAGFGFHLYPQSYALRVYDEQTIRRGYVELEVDDANLFFPLYEHGGMHWMKADEVEQLAFMPMSIELWYTRGWLELELHINWVSFTDEAGHWGQRLREQATSLCQKGWNMQTQGLAACWEASPTTEPLLTASPAVGRSVTQDGYLQTDMM